MKEFLHSKKLTLKSLWFHEKIVDFFGGRKTRENVVVLDFLAVDNFDFTRKNVKKILGENWGFVKIDFYNSVLELADIEPRNMS